MAQVVIEEMPQFPNDITVDKPIPCESSLNNCVWFEQTNTKHDNCNGNEFSKEGVQYIGEERNLINGETDETLNVTQAGTYSVEIHQGNCVGEASNTATVTVAAAPTGNISPANATICSGGSTTLTATGGDSYTWYRNGIEINGQTGSTLLVSQAGTYTVTIHDGVCSGPASNNAVVTVSASPTGTISPGVTSICPGGVDVMVTVDEFEAGPSQSPWWMITV